jgi:hypothetical protein
MAKKAVPSVVALMNTLREIADTPKQGEPCPDDPEYAQDWTDLGIDRPVERLHAIIDAARAALAAAEEG